MPPQAGVEEERHQQMSDDGQPGLIGDGDGALTPGLRLREVVFPGIEALAAGHGERSEGR